MNKEVENQEQVIESSNDVQATEKKLEIIVYDYGDLSVYCHSCGKETPVTDERFQNIQGGLNIPITCNNGSAISLSCGHCAAILSLHFIPAVNPPKEDTMIKETKEGEAKDDIQEESNKEQTI